DDMPFVHFERTSGMDDADPVQEVEVRMRLSAGSQVGMGFSHSEKLDRAAFLGAAHVFPPSFTSPVVAGGEMRSYVLKTSMSGAGSRVRHVLLRPGDQPGATFEVESIRLVLRREHLAAVASGLGWQGLSEIYRETLVARSPEAMKFDLALPSRPRLDVALGTVEDGPVTFRVSVRREGVLFRDCVGQASWTKVATPTLMTALYPSSHGVQDFPDRLPGSAVTLAEVYRDAGYATLSFSSILFTGKFSNLHQGFEEVQESSSLPEGRSSKTAREYVDRLLPW